MLSDALKTRQEGELHPWHILHGRSGKKGGGAAGSLWSFLHTNLL